MQSRNATAYIKIAITAIALLFILLYAYTRVEPFLKGPYIVIKSPANGETVSDPFFFIEGDVRRAAHIEINGRQVYTDEMGRLREEVLLADSINIFEIIAQDRFGRTTKKVLTVIYK